jgi:hypothetical protein
MHPTPEAGSSPGTVQRRSAGPTRPVGPIDARGTRLTAGTSEGIARRAGPAACLRLNARPPTALQPVHLASDARASEPAAERGVTDVVIPRESPQGFAGDASVHQRHIRR